MPLGRDTWDETWAAPLTVRDGARVSRSARRYSSSNGAGGYLAGLALALGLTLLVRVLFPLIARWMDAHRAIALTVGAALGLLLGAFVVPRVYFPERHEHGDEVLGPLTSGEVVASAFGGLLLMCSAMALGILVLTHRTAQDVEVTPGPRRRSGAPVPLRIAVARVLDLVDLIAVAIAVLAPVALVTASFFYSSGVTVAQYLDGETAPSMYSGPVTFHAILLYLAGVAVHKVADVSSATLRGRKS